jgi:hypothetical protein
MHRPLYQRLCLARPSTCHGSCCVFNTCSTFFRAFSKDLAESSPNEGNAQANSKEVTVNNSQYSRRCSSHFTIPPCCLNLLHPPCLLVKSLVYCISSATLRSVFSSEVYDLRLGSGFRPTGGRDLGGGRVCIPGIGKGGRIIVKAGLGERHLRIG